MLHGFGLSLLVPNAAYEAVRQWVDSHHLDGKLVYFRVPERLARRDPTPAGQRPAPGGLPGGAAGHPVRAVVAGRARPAGRLRLRG